MPRFFFEDFEPGAITAFGGRTVSQDELIAFAREFDPQPMHTDPVAAKEGFTGGLIGSGWHSCSLLMRMIADDFILESSSMGSPGIDEVKWLKPVRPGDTLSGRRTVLEARASRSRPEMGLVRFCFDLLNQTGETVLSQTNWIMFGTRAGAAAAPDRRPAPPARRPEPAPAAEPAASVGSRPAPFVEDIRPGDVAVLGTHHFSTEEIVRFASAFDPQPFHVDAEAARHSFFGALCASGWHTSAVWMKLMMQRWERETREAAAQGLTAARLGPSPGVRDLRWLKPVYAGDTLTYRSQFVSARPSASRPGWGIVAHRNFADNQNGERVFEFNGAAFWERRS